MVHEKSQGLGDALFRGVFIRDKVVFCVVFALTLGCRISMLTVRIFRLNQPFIYPNSIPSHVFVAMSLQSSYAAIAQASDLPLPITLVRANLLGQLHFSQIALMKYVDCE
jgi:hypothetical protein